MTQIEADEELTAAQAEESRTGNMCTTHVHIPVRM